MSEKKDKILLFGYGRYGEQIAQSLLSGGYEVYVVDESKEALKRASMHDIENLFLIDIDDDEKLTDLLFDYGFEKIFCAYDEEEKNIYLTITFKALFHHVQVFALCESKESERKLHLAGADRVIDTMEAAANRMFFLVEKPAVAEAFDHILLKDPNIIFKEIVVPKGSFLDGVNIKEINFSKEYDILLIGIVDKELGDHFTFVTRGINHKIDAEDILVVIGKREKIEHFEQILEEKKE
ncbi:potassium channel family protein [Nitratiruptor sp. SB155-2]|uniref:potassium channel family protein n=1 Tax=Nitratiruptor sp. (strain SB155-2) TaxID=387092 RepID=UPI000158704C|nr:NAD-binding protein [Nitratiruptor sp. SB155-2]BAF69970.1 potassium channel protein [Nitratiruptor sp. SB155-2]